MLAVPLDYAPLISPVPMSICLMGQLLLVTAKSDFSLAVEPTGKSDEESSIIRDPESLRASILQLGDMAWESFNAANCKMEDIKLLSSRVTPYVKDIVKVRTKK